MVGDFNYWLLFDLLGFCWFAWLVVLLFGFSCYFSFWNLVNLVCGFVCLGLSLWVFEFVWCVDSDLVFDFVLGGLKWADWFVFVGVMRVGVWACYV